MKGALQKYDFRSSQYERPNQTWACGRLAEGRPCQRGPDAKGVCHADYECHPVKHDDRWQCARSDLAGGRCETGPLPDGTCCRPVPRCRPVMNWRARPGALGRRVAALTLGLLLILLAGSAGPRFLSPGPLTFQHGGVTDCNGCHVNFRKGPTAWIRAAFAETSDIADSERCLTCHDFGDHKFRPHNLSPKRLAALSLEVNAGTAGSWAMAPATAAMIFDPPATDERLSCGTCHQEHHGNTFDLAAMDNNQCQVCHIFQFAALAGGHPEFFDYPYKRRTRIVFDHASHFGKHFREPGMKDRAVDECKACHEPDANGRTMQVNGFDAICAACHGAQVQGAGRATAKGIGVFRVPGLDLATLSARGAAIGGWPEDADEETTPFMEFLLSGRKDFAELKNALEGLDLLDLAGATDSQIAAVADLAWRIKTLVHDIAADGVPALKARLEAILGRPLQAGELVDLAGLLPVDAIRAAQRQWFPNLYREVARRRAGRAAPSSAGNDSGDLLASDKKGGDLLSGDKEGGDLLSGDKEGGDLLSGDKEGGDLLSGDGKLTVETPPAEDEGAAEPDTLAAGEEWSAAGGWYRDFVTLRYRPTGHADRFMKAWLDASVSSAPANAAAGRIFESLVAANAPGLCAKCHSIDADADGALTVNWRGLTPDLAEHRFTVFSHRAHFSLLDEDGCLRCHEPKEKAKYLTAYKGRDPKVSDGNFWTIERQDCAECHIPAEAGDDCLTCHNYHIGTFAPTIAHSTRTMSAMGR